MIAWFRCDFRIERNANDPDWKADRVCLIFDFHSEITADGGSYDFMETDDGRALVKISASDKTITAIESSAGFERLQMNVNGLRAIAARNPRKPKFQNGLIVLGEELPRGARNFDWLDSTVK